MIRFYRKFFRNKYPAGLMVMVTGAVWLRFLLVCGSYALRPEWWRLTFEPASLRLRTD